MTTGRLRIVLRAVLLLWAAFWAFFTLAHAFSEGATSLPYVAGGVAVLVAVVVVTWLWPRIGGLALIAGGIAAALFFDATFARLVLALPALMLGLGFVLLQHEEQDGALLDSP